MAEEKSDEFLDGKHQEGSVPKEQAPVILGTAAPKNPLEIVMAFLWGSRWGRTLIFVLGVLAALSLVAQAVDIFGKLWDRFRPHEVVKQAQPDFVKNGYYVESRRTIFDLGPWREVAESERNQKISLAVCYGEFIVHRETDKPVKFIHQISSTSNIEPEVFVNRPYEKLPVEGADVLGKPRAWEIQCDISNERPYVAFPVSYVIFFWNSFNKPEQWDAGTRVYNAKTTLIELEVRFPRWKPAKSLKFQTRPPGGEKEKATPYEPDPSSVRYVKDPQGRILDVDWQIETPSGDKTYWIVWDWS
jgi:hypothetical protein